MPFIERDHCPYCGNQEPYDKVYYCEGCGNVYCDACSKDKELPTCPHCRSHLFEAIGFLQRPARPVIGGQTTSRDEK